MNTPSSDDDHFDPFWDELLAESKFWKHPVTTPSLANSMGEFFASVLPKVQASTHSYGLRTRPLPRPKNRLSLENASIEGDVVTINKRRKRPKPSLSRKFFCDNRPRVRGKFMEIGQVFELISQPKNALELEALIENMAPRLSRDFKEKYSDKMNFIDGELTKVSKDILLKDLFKYRKPTITSFNDRMANDDYRRDRPGL